MKRLTAAIAIAGLLVGVLAAPVAADSPFEYGETVIRDEIDPCTGETMTVYYSWTIQRHEHPNSVLEIVESHFETSTGYVATGRENLVLNNNRFIQVFNWIAVNAETGARFWVKGRFVIDLDSGEPNVAGIQVKCIGSGGNS